MSLVIKQTRVVEVPVNTITLAATCQQAILVDADGQCVGSTASMPSFMPTLLEIDLATGMIKNWTVPTGEQLQDIADTSEIQRMSEGEYHHFMNDRLFRNAVPLEQATTPPQTDDCWVDESHMPYGYFDDERDPALLNSAPTLGSTSAPTQALESDAVTVASTADCAPADQRHNPLEVLDEPTDADTALCPDVPDSFYAAPAKVEPPQNAWTPDGRVFLRDLSAVSAHHNLDMPSFCMYQRFGLMTGNKGAIDLTPAGSGLLLMLRNAKKSADANALVAHFGQTQTTESTQPDPVPVEAEPVATPLTAKPTTRERFAEFLAERGIEPSAPKPTNQISVEYDHLAEKWTAETLSEVGHIATSTVGKFEAIKNVLKKAGLHGVYEINRIEDGLYGYDGSRTLNADTVYMTQGTDGAWSARMPNNRHVSAVIGIDGALTGLLKEMEGIQPEDAVIIETTDDEMRSRNKRRYAVTAKHEHAPKSDMGIPADLPSVMPTPATVEPVADPDDAVPVCTLKKSLDAADSANQIDIEDAPQPICQPARPRYQNPDDHSQTWTGRGKPPEWLQAKLDAGEQLTDYAISDNAA